MFRASLLAVSALLVATQVGAAERLDVRILGVTRGPETTVVSYALTSRAPYPIDFVRVACDLGGPRRSVLDEAVDIQDDVEPGATVTGEVEFNSNETGRGRRFHCRVSAAYRTK